MKIQIKKPEREEYMITDELLNDADDRANRKEIDYMSLLKGQPSEIRLNENKELLTSINYWTWLSHYHRKYHEYQKSAD